MAATFYILHYKKNVDRKRYLDQASAEMAIRTEFVTDFDQGEFDLNEAYRFDVAIELKHPVDRVHGGDDPGAAVDLEAPYAVAG